jgi:hypothetical protein
MRICSEPADASDVGFFAMPEQSKKLIRITICAPKRGKLGLEFDYSDGSSTSSLATVSTIHRLLADHGHSISSDALAAIAFFGHRRVLHLQMDDGRFAIQAPSAEIN